MITIRLERRKPLFPQYEPDDWEADSDEPGFAGMTGGGSDPLEAVADLVRRAGHGGRIVTLDDLETPTVAYLG